MPGSTKSSSSTSPSTFAPVAAWTGFDEPIAAFAIAPIALLTAIDVAPLINMHGNLLKNLPLPPLSINSAVTASPTPGVLPLRISRTTTEPPPMVTLDEISPEDTTVASHVLRSPLRTAG
ncbi:hypothetical protein [Pseudomonas sp. 25 E 4]|nr:hypothetical protein [Pseudomonas sp. 25 E 4]